MSEMPQLRADVLDALTVLVGVGIFQNRDDDAVLVLDALRPARGRTTELRFYDAWMAMRREQFGEAVRLLTELHEDGAGAKAWLCRALLAATLFAVGDASWRSHADAVAEDASDPLATTLARQLRGERTDPYREVSESGVLGSHAPAPAPNPINGRAAVYMRG